ncbi:rod shape-determining protein MreD [Paenibacillus pasadenensis]|nr:MULTISPECIES: rod shape-determining protein MreD [Paenibacillus]QGG57275.1 rod shape-determining protein MreD [Paenibacillus sp. B01]
MKMQSMVLLTFLAFLVQTSLFPWLVPSAFSDRLLPHFTFVLILYAALYRSRHAALLLGAGFGLLQDIVFRGHLLGLHAYAMGLIAYLIGLLLGGRRLTMLSALAVVAIGSLLYDIAVYYVYDVFRFTAEPLAWALQHHIFPSLFLQLAFALAVYIPIRRAFEGNPRAKPTASA